MQGAEYSELGQVLDELARERNIRGPYRVAAFVKEQTGEGPGGTAWSQFFTGESRPKHRNIGLFARAFKLSTEERRELADAYTFQGFVIEVAA